MNKSIGSLWCVLLVAGVCQCTGTVHAEEFEREPIQYSTAIPDNAISRLQARIDAGEARLQRDDRSGYLESVLKELGVPVSSQVLVFSKTSFQRQRIAPRTPRALYFNDDVYVGFCDHGEVVEISAVDPKLGAVFYTLDQDPAEKPRFVRQTDNCLLCHASSNTHGIPGHFVRSVFVDAGGTPVLAMGTRRIDHTSPLEKRWGGWYVTGTHGDQRHLGNLIVADKQREPVENPSGLNIEDVSALFDSPDYLSAHSDLVALMVLEHQTEAQNLITLAGFQTREALYAEVRLNKELGEPPSHRWASTTSRIKSPGEELVKYLLFCEEAPLTAKVTGSTSFATDFAKCGPRDSRGRSLREFDLQKRLFKYPCSYLIYSRAFDALPGEVQEYVLRRIWEVLSGADRTPAFSHLSDADRIAILEILRETKPDLPEYWKPKPSP